jgi:hypothetical protein
MSRYRVVYARRFRYVCYCPTSADRPQHMPGAPHCTIAREARRGPLSGPGVKKAFIVGNL